MKDSTAAASKRSAPTMVDYHHGEDVSASNNPSNGNGHDNGNNNNDWDAEDAKAQPLSNLFQHNLILSPSHEDNEEEEGKAVPVVGEELLDFDDQEEENEEDDADACSVDDSVLALEMFEGVFDASEEAPSADGITPLDDADVVVEEVEVTDTPSVSSSDNSSDSTSVSKRRAEEEEEEERSIKKSKTQEESPIKSVSVPLPKPKKKAEPADPAALKLISDFRDEIVINHEFPEPQHPRRKRPNCLFVNHFGTRLNGKGDVEPVNIPSKNFAKISSEESVSIKTKVTASTRSSESSRSHDTKGTPCVQAETTPSSSTETPCSVPLVVRIVTPSVKKPVRSSRLEDITMEEDDLEPIHHQGGMEGEDIMVLDSNHLPYITSLTENNESPNSPRSTPPPPTTVPGTPTGAPGGGGGASPQNMMPNMMRGPGGMAMNFNRPFPMLQRRMGSFMGGCHPMHQHPAAFAAANGWHGYGPPHPGFGMPPFVPSFQGCGAPPPMAPPSGGPSEESQQQK